MSTRRRVKKNIKQDQLVTYAVSLSRWAQEHFNQVIIGVVVLVAVIAVAVFTANSRQGSSRQAQIQMASAMSQYMSGDYESARTSFDQIADRYDGRVGARARFYRAESEAHLQRYSEALASYDAYLDVADKDDTFRTSAVIGKALCYEGMQNYAEAAGTLATLLETLSPDDPRYVDSAYRAAEFYARAGDDKQAAKYFGIVSEKGQGTLKDKADVAAALLNK